MVRWAGASSSPSMRLAAWSTESLVTSAIDIPPILTARASTRSREPSQAGQVRALR
jgi:hypothetical protein